MKIWFVTFDDNYIMCSEHTIVLYVNIRKEPKSDRKLTRRLKNRRKEKATCNEAT